MNIATKAWDVLSSRPAAAIAGGLAVLLLAGGTATAAATIGNEDIKNGAVSKEKIRKDSAGTWEVKDRTLGGWDLRKDSVGRNVWTPHLRSMIEEWEAGDFSQPGPEGPQGPQGPQGEPGVSGMVTAKPSESIVAVAPGETKTATADCADGKRALSGGYHVKDAKQAVRDQAVITKSGPGPDASFDGTNFGGWEVIVTNSGEAGTFNVYPYVVCAAAN